MTERNQNEAINSGDLNYIITYVVKMSIRSPRHVLRLVAKKKILVTDRPENLWTCQNSS